MTEDYYEYELENPDGWVTKEQPAKPDWIDGELLSIAGHNRHGQPNLKLVWGGSEKSDRSEHSRLKYHAGFSKREVHGYRFRGEDGEWQFAENIDHLPSTTLTIPDVSQEQLGIPRWVIERWISPEELEHAGRFQTTWSGAEKLLRDFPREGVYDAYFVIENLQGKFRQLDRDVIAFLKMKWNFDQKSLAEQERIRDAHEEKVYEMEQKREAELWDAALSFDLKLPEEERERRDEYWAKHHDYKYQEMLAQRLC